MYSAPTYYAEFITAATNAPASQADRVYQMMISISHYASFSGMTKRQLTKLCREAWATVQYMDSPEGQAYCEQLEREMTAAH